MVVPTVMSLTWMPTIRPSVNSEFISGWPHSVSLLAEVAVDVQRLRIERHVGEQHVVHLRHGAAQAVLVELADLEVLEIHAAARRTHLSHLSLSSRRNGAPAAALLTAHLP